jgi:hypothetical protein
VHSRIKNVARIKVYTLDEKVDVNRSAEPDPLGVGLGVGIVVTLLLMGVVSTGAGRREILRQFSRIRSIVSGPK